MTKPNRGLFVAIAGLLGLALCLAWWPWESAAPIAEAPEGPGVRGDVAAVAGTLVEEVGGAAEAAMAAPARESVAGDVEAAVAPRLQGRVLDSTGQPLAGVAIGLVRFDWEKREPGDDVEATAVSDAAGRFEVPLPKPPSVPIALGEMVTLRSTVCGEEVARRELLLVVAPGAAVRGLVRSGDGEPLAEVRARVQSVLLHEFPHALESTVVLEQPGVVSDTRGAFEWPRAPVAAGVELSFARQGFVTTHLPSTAAAGGVLEVVLTTLSGSAGRVRGRVVDAAGPVAGASLMLGFDQTTTSDAAGGFEFAAPRRATRLLAMRRGWQPVSIEGVEPSRGELEVVFAAKALAIDGMVCNANGEPLPGLRVELADPVRGPAYGSAEGECSELAPALATTDAEGRFAIGGLADRSYRLLVFAPEAALAFESGPIAAGSRGVVVTAPADALVAELRGVVVDRRGAPVVGAVAHVYLAPPGGSEVVSGRSVTTGGDGTFVLHHVSRRVAKLGVSKEGYRFVTQPVEVVAASGAVVRVELVRMCAMQVEGEAGLSVGFLDADGSLLHAESHSDGMILGTNAVVLRGGKSAVMTLPETTATMVWSRDGREVGRKAVFLDPTPGAVTLLIAAP